MRFTVIWRPEAIQELTDVWLRSADRDAVSKAAAHIDKHLRDEASVVGQPHYAPTRIIIVPPLAALYELDEPDCQAIVLAVVNQR